MADVYIVIGVALLIVGIFSIFSNVLVIGIPLIIVAAFFLFQYYYSSGKHVNKKYPK
ncbi:hypothetical protein [Acidiplasma cupricumulans]|uniref:hypothetical protein n=1 Tax=Acidiplasma cupricumulans TaxID=312540 RepID=UPI000A7C18C8|nr:hypothetical protein [Acidiplasma cupricumulans]